MAPRISKKMSEAHRSRDWRQSTTMTFSSQDLLALTRLVAAGQVLLNTTHPVVSRLRAAMTRMGFRLPQGL